MCSFSESCVLIHFRLVCRRLKLFPCFVFFPHRLPCRRTRLALPYFQALPLPVTRRLLGLQRETASRGALATQTPRPRYVFYTGVAALLKCLNYSRLSLLLCLTSSFFIRRLLHCQLLEQPYS